MKNIVELPKRKMNGVDGLQKAESRQILLSLAVICTVMAAVLLNDSALKSQRPIYVISDLTNPEAATRFMASTENGTLMKDVEWEHRLAKKLAEEGSGLRAPSSISNSVSKIDQMRYGALAGKYSVLTSLGHSDSISRIEYVASNDVTDHPVFMDPSKFLNDYRGMLAVHYEKFEKDSAAEGKLAYGLFDSTQKRVGQATFELDSEGRVLSVNVLAE